MESGPEYFEFYRAEVKKRFNLSELCSKNYVETFATKTEIAVY